MSEFFGYDEDYDKEQYFDENNHSSNDEQYFDENNINNYKSYNHYRDYIFKKYEYRDYKNEAFRTPIHDSLLLDEYGNNYNHNDSVNGLLNNDKNQFNISDDSQNFNLLIPYTFHNKNKQLLKNINYKKCNNMITVDKPIDFMTLLNFIDQRKELINIINIDFTVIRECQFMLNYFKSLETSFTEHESAELYMNIKDIDEVIELEMKKKKETKDLFYVFNQYLSLFFKYLTEHKILLAHQISLGNKNNFKCVYDLNSYILFKYNIYISFINLQTGSNNPITFTSNKPTLTLDIVRYINILYTYMSLINESTNIDINVNYKDTNNLPSLIIDNKFVNVYELLMIKLCNNNFENYNNNVLDKQKILDNKKILEKDLKFYLADRNNFNHLTSFLSPENIHDCLKNIISNYEYKNNIKIYNLNMNNIVNVIKRYDNLGFNYDENSYIFNYNFNDYYKYVVLDHQNKSNIFEINSNFFISQLIKNKKSLFIVSDNIINY
jgi:hypothetical protein